MKRDTAVLITGGSRGIGRAIAERLAREGATVGVLARTDRDVQATAASIRDWGGQAHGFACDVLDQPRLQNAFGRFRNWAGRFDALVCAAGQLEAVGPFARVDPARWWRDVETALRGTQQSIREALPYLRDSSAPSISILVGAGHNSGLPFATGYAVAQAGLVRLAESLGHELSAEDMVVYAVQPGLVLTDLTRPWLESHEGRRWLPQWNEAFAEGKEVAPEVAAEMVAWLIEHRPSELSGRVVAAPLSPTILETRMDRIAAENRGVLRLR